MKPLIKNTETGDRVDPVVMLRELGSKLNRCPNVDDDALKDPEEVYDWRNHVPKEIGKMWTEFTERERWLIALTADACANREEWD